jgi:cell division protein FtsQ
MSKLPSKSAPNRRVRAGARQSRHLLDVKLRASTARRQRNRKLGRFVTLACLWISMSVASYFAYQLISKRFFLENSEYNLTHVDANLDGLLTTEETLALTGMEIGRSIFEIDLYAAQAALRRIDQVADARVERIWPNRIAIHVRQRRPVAWLAHESWDGSSSDQMRLVDPNGFCMKPYKIDPNFWHLPVIYTARLDETLAGEVLARADLQAALDLLRERSIRPAFPLNILSLNISKGYAIDVRDDHNATFVFAPNEFADQFDRLGRLLRHCQETERHLEFVNLIPKRNTPARFFLTASIAPQPPASTQTRKR